MTTLRLAVLVLRGGGSAGIVRLMLMVIGIVIGVFAVTMVVAVPGILSDRAERSSARLPQSPRPGQDVRFEFSIVEDSWHGAIFTRVFLHGTEAEPPPPPGLARFPRAGEVILSPAAAKLLATEPQLADRLPGRVVGAIGSDGLLGPDELYAYVGVTHNGLARPSEAARFGVSTADDSVTKQLSGIGRELGLLILGPTVVYLVVCGRLAAGTRSRRYAAFRILGMRRRQVLTVAAGESAFAGAAGAVIGISAYALLSPLIGGAGLLGFTWYADESSLGAGMLVAIVILVLAVATAVGAVGVRHSLSRPLVARFAVEEPRPRVWLLMPLAVGVCLMAPSLFRSSSQRSMDAFGGWLLIIGIALATAGVLVALRPLVAALGRGLIRQRPLYLRVAGNRLACESSSSLRLVAGPVLLALVAGVGAGILQDAKNAAGPTVSAFSTVVYARDVPNPLSREQVFAVPAARRWVFQSSSVGDDVGSAGTPIGSAAERIRMIGLPMMMASCTDVRVLVRSAMPDCRDGVLYRIVDSVLEGTIDDVPAGLQVRYRNERGELVPVTTPQQRLDVPDLQRTPLLPGLLFTTTMPTFGWSQDLVFQFLIEGEESELERFKSQVAHIAPMAYIQVNERNLKALEAYKVHRGSIEFGVLVGFLLCTLALVVGSVDRMVDRRRDVAVLSVVGVRSRTIRAIQLAQLAGPLLGGLVLAGAIGHLAGNAVLKLNGRQHGWYVGTIGAMGPLVGIAIVAVGMVGLIVVGSRVRAEDLRRE